MPYDAGFTKNILQNIPLAKPQVNQPLPTNKKELQGLLRAQQQGTVNDIMQALGPAIEKEIQRQINLGVAQKVQEILEGMRLARHRQFGSSSERQGQLFNEAELYANDDLFIDPTLTILQQQKPQPVNGANADPYLQSYPASSVLLSTPRPIALVLAVARG